MNSHGTQNSRIEWINAWKENLSRVGYTYYDKYFIRMASYGLELIQFPESALKILDIGCNYGDKTAAFSQIGCDSYGIDINFNSIKKANDIFRSCYFCVGNMECLPIKSRTFDLIFSANVMQYVNHDMVLSECNRVLKQEGSIILIENLKNNPIPAVYRLIQKHLGASYPPFQNPRAYLKWGELSLLNRYFEVVDFRPFFLISPVMLMIPAINKYLLRQTDVNLVKRSSPDFGSSLFKALYSLDKCILKFLPSLANFSWMVVIKAVKRKDV